MTAAFTDFPRTRAAIESGTDRRLHTGVQIYVSLDGSPCLNSGLGMATDSEPYTADTVSLWRSAGKPVTAGLVLELVESSEFDLSATLSELLPDTSSTGVGGVTLQQLLTHTSGLPVIETGWPETGRDQIIDQIKSIESITARSAYQPQTTWFLLGAILERYRNRSFSAVLEELVTEPLGMIDTWCGVPESLLETLAKRLPQFWIREKGQLAPSPFGEAEWLTNPSPGGNLRGPVRNLGRYYEMLMRNGQSENGTELLSKKSVELMTSRHRVGQFDETLQHVVDFGLGVIIDSNHYGEETVPYGFGRYCSSSTFGHGGSQCAMGFCDPDRRLVVCWAANGFCGEGQHQRRNRAINEAVYEDLGLV